MASAASGEPRRSSRDGDRGKQPEKLRSLYEEDGSLHLLELELQHMQSAFDAGEMRAFGGEAHRREMFREINTIREMQMDAFKAHMSLELNFPNIEPKKDFASGDFCEHFQKVFKEKESEVQRLESKLEELTTLIGGVNKHMLATGEESDRQARGRRSQSRS